MLINIQIDIEEKIIMGAKAERNGERVPDDPIALEIPKTPQNAMDIATAMPIPKRVPFFPILNEKGMAISTMIRLDIGKEYL